MNSRLTWAAVAAAVMLAACGGAADERKSATAGTAARARDQADRLPLLSAVQAAYLDFLRNDSASPPRDLNLGVP